MAQTRLMEITVGLFVCLGVAALLLLTLQASTAGTLFGGAGETYEVRASFQNIGNLNDRAPVSISGVRVGRVTEIRFNPDQFEAVVVMAIDEQYDMLPKDTSAKILTKGLLGEQYVGLEPGASRQTLSDGDELRFTSSALILEEMISQFMFSEAQKEQE